MADVKTRQNLILENVNLIYTNFSGRGSQFNAEGNRNFCVVLPAEAANSLADEGWNVKMRGTEDDPEFYIAVNLSYAINPPDVIMVTRNPDGKIVNKQSLSEDMVGLLDSCRIDFADLTIYPYHWARMGGSGIKGYVRKMYVNITQDSYEDKYRMDDDIEDKYKLEDDDMPF